MKIEVNTLDGKTFVITGAMMVVNDETGQTIVYGKNDPTYKNIVAVIPASAVVIVVSREN